MAKEEAVEVFPSFKTFKVAQTFGDRSYVAKLFDNAETAKGAPVFVGFPNIGITPVLAINFLLQDLELPLIGSIRSKKTPPVSVISSQGQPGPSIRIHGSKDLIIIGSEMKAEGNMKHLIDVIMEVVKRMESKLIWCVEGVGVEKIDKINREKLRYVTCNEKIADKLQDMGHEPFHNAMLAGITGGLITETCLSEADFDIAALLVPTCSLYPDAMSSVVAIKTIAKIQAWKSEPKQLEKSAMEVEKKVQELLAGSLRKSGSGWSSMYQ